MMLGLRLLCTNIAFLPSTNVDWNSLPNETKLVDNKCHLKKAVDINKPPASNPLFNYRKVRQHVLHTSPRNNVVFLINLYMIETWFHLHFVNPKKTLLTFYWSVYYMQLKDLFY